MSIGNEKSRFELEALEPRLLLSGDGVAVLSAAPKPVVGPMPVEEHKEASSSSPISADLAYQPENQLDGIFAGGKAGSSAGEPGQSTLAQSPNQPLTASPGPGITSQTTNVGAASSIPGSTDQTGADLPLSSQTLTSNPTAEQLTETLRAANGPPGQGPFKLTAFSPPSTTIITTAEIWSGGEEYGGKGGVWRINLADGTEGTDPGWDRIDMYSTLKIDATSSNQFKIKITSLDSGNNTGNISDFHSDQDYSWRIVRTIGGIKGFDRAAFDLDTSGFLNSRGGGFFVIDLSSDSNDLILRFIHTMPSVLLDQPDWKEEGPFSLIGNTHTAVFPNSPTIGAVQAIAIDPADPKKAFLGAASGGVWYTENLTDASPHWVPLGDNLPSLAISSLALSPFDATGTALGLGTPRAKMVVFAGTGDTSNSRQGGFAAGMFQSGNGGDIWGTAGDFSGLRVNSITPSKITPGLVFASTRAQIDSQSGSVVRGGLYRSTNNGVSWVRLSNKAGLPDGDIWDVVEDPEGRIYVSIAGHTSLANNGIYRTDNDLAPDPANLNWQPTVNGITALTLSTRIRLSVSQATGHPIFAGIIEAGTDGKGNNIDKLGGVFRSPNSGANWSSVGTPPNTNPFGQGLLNFAILADPIDPQVVYISGTTIISRGNSGTGLWTSMTASGTVPHSDSRNLAFASDGKTIYAGTDGGLYRVANPLNDPVSLNWQFAGGNLAITEIGFSVAWDPNTHSIFAGTQDNGGIRQISGTNDWVTLSSGDGNFVGAGSDGTTTTRYYMGNNFHFFYRQTWEGPDSEINPASRSITNVTNNGGLIQIETASHGLMTGDSVSVFGVVGVPDANVFADVTVRDASHFTLDLSSFHGGYISGGFWKKLNPITGATGAGVPVQITSNGHGLRDGDKVEVFDMEGNTEANNRIFAVTRDNANQFTLDGVVGNGKYTKGGYWFHSNKVLLRDAPGHEALSGLNKVVGLEPDFSFDGFTSIPIAVNAVDPKRLLLGRIGLYESSDWGDTVERINIDPSSSVSALAYGGKEGLVPHWDVIYMARGRTISVRAPGDTSLKPTNLPDAASRIRHIALDPQNWKTAVAVDEHRVWLTVDAGANWFDVTSNLSDLISPQSDFTAVEVVNRAGQLVLVVGARDGVYRAFLGYASSFDGKTKETQPKLAWTRFGAGFPNVLVTDLKYEATDDVLVAGTLGRGAWSMRGAVSKLFADPVLRIDTGNGDDIVKLTIPATAAFSPKLLEVVINGDSAGYFPLTAIGQIDLHAGGGDDTLIVDSGLGEIVVPRAIRFDGGSGKDKLDFQGRRATDLQTDTDGDVKIRQMGRQIVRAINVEDFADSTGWESFLALIGKAFAAIGDFFSGLVDGIADLFGSKGPQDKGIEDTFFSVLKGTQPEESQPATDPENGPASADSQANSEAVSVFTRLFESGGFRFSDIGTVIATGPDLQAKLDSLDSIPGNVTVDSVTKRLVLGDPADPAKPFRRTLSFAAPIDLDLLGGLLSVHGSLQLAVDIDLMLELGVDDRGFYVATDATTRPEIVVHNLRVEGSITATGRFGLLEVAVENATISVDPQVRLEVNLKEPAGNDPFGHAPDGKLRVYELASSPAKFFDISIKGNPVADDLTLTAGIRVAGKEPDGPPLFDLPLATVQVIWPDITSPLRVHVRPVGGPAEALLKFLDFSPADAVGELQRLLNHLTELGSSALLDVKLPFGSGLTLGGSFNFPGAFLDTIYAHLVDVKVVASTGNGSPSGALASGQLSADAAFMLTIDEAPPVTVTVTAAMTASNANLMDLVADFNTAINATSLVGKVKAILDGRQLALQLLSGTSLTITGDSSSPAFTELGFTEDTPGIEVPKFPTLQSLLGELEADLDPDGPGGLSFDLNPQFDLSTKLLTFAVSFGYHIDKSTAFKYDPNIGLGDLVDVSASGQFNLSINLHLGFTLGFDFNPASAPKMITSLAVPPPSSGRLTANSSFDIVVNDDERYHVVLLKSDTAGFTKLSQLVTYLNTKLAGTPLDHVLRFVQAGSGDAILLEAINEDLDADGHLDVNEDTNGNHILDPGEDLDNDGRLDVAEDTINPNGLLDTTLNTVTSIAIEADSADPIVTEVGFNGTASARSTIKGLFLQDTELTATLSVSANNLAASAHFAIFGISTSGGTATGSAGLTLKFKNPHDLTHPNRIALDLLLKHVDDLGNYVTSDTKLTGSVDIRLNNITVTPNLPTLSGQPLLSPSAQFRIFIPDIHDLHYNSDAYNGSNTGTFVTFPELGSLGDFRCVSFLDVASALQSLSDSLKGLKEFSFLSQRLPLINVSISDILDFAGNLAKAFQKLAAGDTATIATLESDLEAFFGVAPDKLWIKVDDLPAPKTSGGTGGTPATAVFNPSGQNNALDFTATSNGAAFNDVKIDFVDDGSFTGVADAATASYDAVKKVLTIHYHATYTTANTVVSVVNSAGVPFTAALDSSGGGDSANNGSGVITETAIKFHLEYGLSYGQFLPLQFNLSDLIALAGGDPTLSAFLAGVSDLIQVEGSGNLNVTASATLTLEFGLDVSSPCHFEPFVYDTTGFALKAAIRGTALNFKIGIGALSVSIKNGTATLDGDGDPNTTSDSAAFVVAFKDNNGDGRHYFREDILDLSNIDISLTAGASAVLPLFALSSLPIGSTADNNHDGFPDNDLVVKIADLKKVFNGDPNSVVIITPDIASLFKELNVCDLVNHPELLIDGLDALLGTIQAGLGNRVFGRNLPLIGNELGKAADFIGKFRSGLLADIRRTLADGGDPITLVKKAIFGALGQPGLDILVKPDGTPLTSAADVSITCTGNAIEFNLRLKKSIALVDTTSNPIDFNIGIPGLGLQVHANVKVEIGFDLRLRFGISPEDGFYFRTDSKNDKGEDEELRLEFKVTIPMSHAIGQLLFLQLDVSDESDGKTLKGKPRESSSFSGFFSVDLKDPVGPGNKLTFADMMNPAFNFDKFIDAKLGAIAGLHLDFAVSFGGSTVIPRLVGEFDLDWTWIAGGPETKPRFGFHNLALDIGSFVGDFIKPILLELHKYTEPLAPLVEVMTKRLPIISDLAGRDFTLLDLAEQWGVISPGTRRFLDVLITIINLANDNSVSNNGSVLLFLGDLNLDFDKFGKVNANPADLAAPKPDFTNTGESASASYSAKVGKLGIDFPFLKVSEIFKLFTGKPISFVEFHLPTLDFKASFKVVIPIFGPLYVKFGGSISAHIDLFVGYDSFGLQKFLSSSQKNVLDIFDGFYIKDVDENGVDVPEISFNGNLWASGSIDILIAEAGVRGGFRASVDFNLNDPNNDGRVHISELVANAKKDIRCIFDIHGKFTAYLEAFLTINFAFIHIDEKYVFAEVTLLDFTVTCPEPKLADYVNGSGVELKPEDSIGILRLNIGKYADQREFGDMTDGDETFVVTHIQGDATSGEKVEVSFMGIKQTYKGVKSIYADGGAGADVIDLRGVRAPAYALLGGIRGGAGNDTLYAGRGGGPYFGDADDDIIIGEVAGSDFAGAADEFHGGDGSDTLTGNEGDDHLYGDEGADVIHGNTGNDILDGGGGNDLIFGDAGNDAITGGEGADTLDGGIGDDTIMGNAGDDTITGGRGDDRIVGGEGDDVIDGGAGNDVILGDLGTILSSLHVIGIDGNGNDLIAGGAGADVIFGAGGDDHIFGGTFIESGVTTVTEVDEEDFIDGGSGNDVIFADDAHSQAVTSFPGANIGDEVWFDALDTHAKRNGIRDPGEIGVANVKVELLDSTNKLIATTSTDAKGNYKFVSLPAGDYYLKFTLPTGLAFTDQDQGKNDAIDSDVNPVTGRTATFHIDAGKVDFTRDAGLKGTTPVLTIDNPSIKEGDTGTQNLAFTVTLSSISDQVVTVCYKSAPGTADRITDYSSVDYTLVFQPGETQKTILVPIKGDTIDEPNETFTVTLAQPNNATVDLAAGIGTGTIIDDDPTPVITVSDGVQVDPNPLDNVPPPEITPVTFTIRLSNPSSRTIVLNYMTAQVVDNSGLLVVDAARAGVDYTNLFETLPGTVIFAPGETKQTVNIAIFGDVLNEYDEQFLLNVTLAAITPSEAAKMGDSQGTGRILDDDPLPFVRWEPPTAKSVPEGQAGNTTVTFNIRLTDVSGLPNVSGRAVTVTWNTTRGTAVDTPEAVGESPDFVSKLEMVKFAPGETVKTISVEIIGDTHIEPDEYFFLNLLSAANGQIDTTDTNLNHAVVNILNDESGDPGPWYVEFSSQTYSVNENDGVALITLTRAEGSSEPAAVYWTLGGTATDGVDYLGIWENGGPSSLPPGRRGKVFFGPNETVKTFPIQIYNDNVYEGDETVNLFLKNPTGGAVRSVNQTAVLTIHDDDPPPKIIVSDARNVLGVDTVSSVKEGPGLVTLDFDVVVSGNSSLPVKVDWAAYNGTALATTDFFPIGPLTLNFGPVLGSATQTVSVTVKNDLVPEVLEYLYARLKNPVNAVITRHEGIGYIYDDDLAKAGGFVFYDANGNRSYDPSTDYPLADVNVKITDFNGDQFTTTDASGSYSAMVLLGDVTATLDEKTTPVGSEVSTGNNPQKAHVTSTALAFKDIGFTVKPKKGKPGASIGNGLVFFNDTVYGGVGNDVINGGGGDDWLIGGHWLGPGCACAGKPYDATLLQQPKLAGNRKYVDPASLPAPGTIEGRAWLDANLNNLDIDGEGGVTNIQVNLYDSDWVLVASTWTSGLSGAYRFEKLAPCNYYVQFLPPAGYKFAVKHAGPPSVDSDADTVTGLTDIIAVAPGATVSDIDAGMQAVAPGSSGPWSLQFDHLVYSVRETDGQAAITILRTPGSFEPAGDYYTQDGTATNLLDYLGTKGGVFFGVDENTKLFVVPILNDNLPEAPETVRLFLKNPTGGQVTGNLSAAVLLIFDNPCPDNDTIYGADGNDVILGDFGYFDITGLPVLLGGMGNDSLFGDNGSDKIYGEGGDDTIEGGAGNDSLDGGSENDTYRFDGDKNMGNDTIAEAVTPFGGTDTIDLSQTTGWPVTLDLSSAVLQPLTPSFSLTLPAGNVIENVTGGSRDDVLTGNALDNVIDGGPGNDTLVGGAGNDHLIGGPGNDTYLYDADTPLGHDNIIEMANAGTELIDFSATTTQSVSLNLASSLSQTVNPNLSITLSSKSAIENLYGGAMNDTLLGNALDNIIQGREGDDTLDGGAAGYDTLLENRAGNFNLTNATLSLGAETDNYANFDEVSLVGDDNANTLDASAFSGTVRLDGRGGNDIITGGSGLNFLSGGPGSDTIDGSRGLDLIIEQRDANFTLRNTSLTIGGEMDTFIGIIEAAWLTGGDGNNMLDASAFAGNVLLDGGAGNDVLTGTPNPDILVGGPGDDALRGGDGGDFYFFNTDGALGSDTITESNTGGVDTLDFSPTTALSVTVNLGATAPQTVNSNLTLTLSGGDVIENLRGSQQGDTLIGNALDNKIEGLDGNDSLTGGLGNDILDGGAGPSDRVVETRDANFNLTNASLVITGENDTLIGIEQAVLTGGPSSNALDASAFTNGPVTLDGAGGDDTLLGGWDNDFLTGGAGNDFLAGGPGHDTYLFDADTDIGTDTVSELAGGGTDTLDYSATTDSIVTVNLSVGVVQNAAVAPALIVRHRLILSPNIENLTGGALDDTLIGNDLPNVLSGEPGNDSLTGLGGDDTLIGGDGNDKYFFDADISLGTDTIVEDVGTGGTDTLDFSSTTTQNVNVNLSSGAAQIVNLNLNLRLITCHSIENVIGGALHDVLIGNSLANRIEGGAGNDTLIGGSGDDTYVFNTNTALGTDTILENADEEGGTDTLDFSASTTLGIVVDISTPALQIVNANLRLTLLAASSIENVTGGTQNDTIIGNASANILIGGDGDDSIQGGDGNDTLNGGNGNDVLNGGAGNDTYVFADGWGADSTIEAVNAGTDALDFSAVTISVAFTVGANLQVTSGVNSVLHLGANVEKLFGGSAADTFNVTPTTTTPPFTLNGNGGLDQLNFNAMGLTVTQTADTITAAGLQTVAYYEIETVHIL